MYLEQNNSNDIREIINPWMTKVYLRNTFQKPMTLLIINLNVYGLDKAICEIAELTNVFTVVSLCLIVQVRLMNQV